MGDEKKTRRQSAPAGAQGRSAPNFDFDEMDDTEKAKAVGTAAEPEVLDADRQPAGQPKAMVRSGSLPGKSDLLQAYLTEIRHHPILDREEEKELAMEYLETQDQTAAKRLVTSNLRLVVKLAFQYHRQWSNVLDLIQEGNMGLVEALSRYDPYRGIRFSSYAQYWIRAMILRYLMDNYRMVRLGSTRHGRKLFFQLNKEKKRLEAMGIKPTSRALSEALEVPEEEIINVDQHMRAPAMSIHAPASGEEGRELSEVIPDKIDVGPEVHAARGELGAQVASELSAFAETLRDDREREIWTDRLVAEDPVSLAVLGERYGVSKERIRQIEARIRKRLKLHLKQTLGDELDFEFDVPSSD
jgi:RNA polymerase sigma-32 factor